MATNKNITMKQFNGTDYDTLYPKTKVEQVEDAYAQQQILADSTKTLYGLDATAVPDDVLALLKTLVDNAQTSADEKAKMQVGSYVGTGTYGSDNPNSLTFDGKPKFVFVAQKAQSTSSARGYYFTAVVNQETAMVERVATDSTSTDAHFVQLSWGDKTVSWYSIANAERQLNTSGTEYVYTIFY